MNYNSYSQIDHQNPLNFKSVFDSSILQTLENHAKSFPAVFDNGVDQEMAKNHPNHPKHSNTFRKTSDIKHFSKNLNPFLVDLNKLISEVNNRYQFKIHDINFIYAEYIKHTSHLAWHNDVGCYPYNLRKISFSINLNDPSEYEGGNLEFAHLRGKLFSKNKGSITFFPSILTHRVTPVTKGLRKMIIGFIEGPPFK